MSEQTQEPKIISATQKPIVSGIISLLVLNLVVMVLVGALAGCFVYAAIGIPELMWIFILIAAVIAIVFGVLMLVNTIRGIIDVCTVQAVLTDTGIRGKDNRRGSIDLTFDQVQNITKFRNSVIQIDTFVPTGKTARDGRPVYVTHFVNCKKDQVQPFIDACAPYIAAAKAEKEAAAAAASAAEAAETADAQ